MLRRRLDVFPSWWCETCVGSRNGGTPHWPCLLRFCRSTSKSTSCYILSPTFNIQRHCTLLLGICVWILLCTLMNIQICIPCKMTLQEDFIILEHDETANCWRFVAGVAAFSFVELGINGEKGFIWQSNSSQHQQNSYMDLWIWIFVSFVELGINGEKGTSSQYLISDICQLNQKKKRDGNAI